MYKMTAMRSLLPPQLRVLVRDWLSGNNVVLRSRRDGHVVVDSGYVKHAALTLELLESDYALAGEPLAKVVNTHCHSDHMGGNAAIKEKYACPIALPEDEAPIVAQWDTKALLLDYADQTAPRFAADELLRRDDVHVWGDLEWHVIAAPGHDMRAVVFYNPEYRILISGDALWENGYGFVMPPAIDPVALAATRATLVALAELDIRVVVPGHGDVFTDVEPALARAFARTESFAEVPERLARHALKVALTFSLLNRERMPLSDLPAYVSRIGLFRDINACCLQLSPVGLAEMLVRELERAGAVKQEDGWLRPC